MDDYIILQDAINKIKVKIDKEILKNTPYFDALLSFESDQQIVIDVPDAVAAYDIIKNLHGETWKHQLEKIRFQDFLGLEPIIPSDLKIPAEDFGLLLEVAELNGFGENIIATINDNLPPDYDLSLLSPDLISKMIEKASSLRIISASGDRSIKIWDLMKGTLIDTIVDTTSIYSVVCTQNYEYIISGGDDHEVKIFDAKNGTIINTLRGHTNKVQQVVISPDDKNIASASWDSSVIIWDIATGSIIHTLRGHTGTVHCVAYSPDGSKVASGQYYNCVKVWNALTGILLNTFDTAVVPDIVLDLKFSPNAQYITSCSTYNSIKIWDTRNYTLKNTIAASIHSVRSIDYSSDGLYIASGGYDRNVSLWDASSGSLLHTLSGHTDNVLCVKFSPCNKYIISSCENNCIKIWDIKTFILKNTLYGHSWAVHSIGVVKYQNDLAKRLLNSIKKLN